jgi:dTDP-4-amino-4,6-dideoxygalactose transaminase
VSAAVRHRSPRVIEEEHVQLGFNYRLTDIQAAVGRVQLARLPAIVERRRTLAARYQRRLSDLPVELPSEPEWARSNWQSFWIRLPASCERLTLMQRMLDAGVATRPGIACAHRQRTYASEPWRAGPGGLEESERAQEHSLLLPLFHQLTEEEQDRVVDALAAALEAARG